jgi:hypothetical protein
MDTLLYVPVQRNLIDRILDLPAELRRPILLSIWPATLRVHYYLPPRVIVRVNQPPLSDGISPVRLTSVDSCSASSPDYVFRFTDHMVNRRWYQALAEHLNTTTQWDLGDTAHLRRYLQGQGPVFDYRDGDRLTSHEPFLQRLKSVWRTSISLRSEDAVGMDLPTYDQNMKMLLQLPELTEGGLMISTLRLHLDQLFELDSKKQILLADAIAMYAGMLHQSAKGFQRPLHIKIACTEAAFRSRNGQRVSNQIRHRCGDDTVRWVPTAICRYQGQLGDLTVAWEEKGIQLYS